MTYDGYFSDADAPWLPRLIDIEHYKQSSDTEKAQYFGQFGWNQLDHDVAPESDPTYVSRYPLINARWETLTMRFNQKFGYRMLGIETMEHWQNNLQEMFDEVAPRYEYAYELYNEHSAKFVDDVIEGEQETVDEENQASGTDSVTSTGTSKSWDTPDTAINADASYADSVGTSNSSGGTTYGRKDTHTYERVKLITGKGILENIITSIRDYRDLDTMFITEFEPLFLSVYWY